jgi:hypothetical protein
MKVLFVDPSSSVTGYALMRGRYDLMEFGRITPEKDKDRAPVRIQYFGRELAAIIADGKPDKVVIEITSGKVARGRHGGAGAGLSIYGMAVGYLWRECVAAGVEVEPVLENDWTNGVPKDRRLRHIAAQFPDYAAFKDEGGDAGDAIALGQWWFFIRGGKVGK